MDKTNKKNEISLGISELLQLEDLPGASLAESKEEAKDTWLLDELRTSSLPKNVLASTVLDFISGSEFNKLDFIRSEMLKNESLKLASELESQGEKDLAERLRLAWKMTKPTLPRVSSEPTNRTFEKKEQRKFPIKTIGIILLLLLAWLGGRLTASSKPSANDSGSISLKYEIKPNLVFETDRITFKEPDLDSVVTAMAQTEPTFAPSVAAATPEPTVAIVEKAKIDLASPNEPDEIAELIENPQKNPQREQPAFPNSAATTTPLPKDSKDLVIPIVRSSRVYSHPDKNAAILDALQVGQGIRITERFDKWLKIESNDGRIGYVPSDAVEN